MYDLFTHNRIRDVVISQLSSHFQGLCHKIIKCWIVCSCTADKWCCRTQNKASLSMLFQMEPDENVYMHA